MLPLLRGPVLEASLACNLYHRLVMADFLASHNPQILFISVFVAPFIRRCFCPAGSVHVAQVRDAQGTEEWSRNVFLACMSYLSFNMISGELDGSARVQ